jgi:hypothetical protein
MTTFRLTALIALAVGFTTAAPAAPPDPLKLVPPDAALFLYADIAAVYDSKLGDAVKNSKSAELKEKLAAITKETGLTLADVKSITFVLPRVKEQQDMNRGFTVVTVRQPYDRAKLLAKMKDDAAKMKDEFSEKDHIVRVKSARVPDRVQVTDLRDDNQLVILTGLSEEFLTPPAATTIGVHTDALKAATKSAVVVGLNFNALPDEIRGDNLPAEVKPFQPIVKADTLTLAASLGKDTIDVKVQVKAKTAADAAEVEKSLEAVRVFAAVAIPAAKKSLDQQVADSASLGKLLDVAAKALGGAKFAVEDKVASASLSAPIDLPLAPLLTVLSGGGASVRAQSSNNLKQMALAVHNYEAAHGFLPPAATLGKKGKKLLSWRVAVLPYIEQDALYQKFKLDEPWDSEHNLKVFKDNPMPRVFAIPGTKNLDEKKTHYQTFVGNGAAFDPVAAIKFTDFTDGTSNTILFATAATAVEWTKPDDIEFDPKADVKKLLLVKDGVFLVAMGDGSVRAVTEKLSEQTLKALVTRNGGEVIGPDFE